MTAPPLEIAFAIPGALETPTGGYAYAREVLARMPAHGLAPRVVRLPDGFPNPSEHDLAQTIGLLAGIAAETPLLVDGLAYGAMPAEAIDAVARPIVALCHHPLGLEAGLSSARAAELVAGERAALARAVHVIVTSPITARTLVADFDVPPERITVAEPGTDPAPAATGSGDPSRPTLVAVGAISPRKGFDLLIEAVARLADRGWRLMIVGPTDRDPATFAALDALVARHGLRDRIRFTGAVDAPTRDAILAQSDIFVSSSLYEGYGMSLAEALARGLPLVASTGGAAAETVPDDAALKVPPGDLEALTAALARILDDAALRTRLAAASRAAGARLPTWDDTTARIASVLARTRETMR